MSLIMSERASGRAGEREREMKCVREMNILHQIHFSVLSLSLVVDNFDEKKRVSHSSALD